MTRHLKEAQHYGATAAIRAAAEAKRAADAAQFLAEIEAASVRNPVYTTAGAIQNAPGSIIMGSLTVSAANLQTNLQNQLASANNALNTMIANSVFSSNHVFQATASTASQQASGGREHTRKLHKGKKR
jgi:hypothetical protein